MVAAKVVTRFGSRGTSSEWAAFFDSERTVKCEGRDISTKLYIAKAGDRVLFDVSKWTSQSARFINLALIDWGYSSEAKISVEGLVLVLDWVAAVGDKLAVMTDVLRVLCLAMLSPYEKACVLRRMRSSRCMKKLCVSRLMTKSTEWSV